MRRLAWILTLPATLAVVAFAVANRQPVEINLWPFERVVGYPLFAVVLAALVLGFLLGAVTMWLSEGRLRDNARRARFQKEDLERELAYLRRQQAKAGEAGAAGAGLPATAGQRAG